MDIGYQRIKSRLVCLPSGLEHLFQHCLAPFQRQPQRQVSLSAVPRQRFPRTRLFEVLHGQSVELEDIFVHQCENSLDRRVFTEEAFGLK